MLTWLSSWWNKPGDEVADATRSAFQSGRLVEREANAQLCEARAADCEKKAESADGWSDATELRALAWQLRVMADKIRTRGAEATINCRQPAKGRASNGARS